MADEPTTATPPTPTVPTAPTPPTTTGGPVQLPDDHPLVKAFATQKAELVDAKKRLSDIDEANKTDAQRRDETNAALQAENVKLKATSLRSDVAVTKGLTARQAKRLVGSTLEELLADADEMLADVKGTPGGSLPGNLRTAGPVSQVQTTEETREDRIKRLESSLKR